MKKSIKNALILTMITVVSGCLLGLVYEITKEPIAKAQEKAKQQAYKTVLAEADTFADMTVDVDEAAQILNGAG